MKSKTLLGMIAFSVLLTCQRSSGAIQTNLIQSISYEQNTAGNDATFDIHVAVSPNDGQNPCGPGTTISVDPVSLKQVASPSEKLKIYPADMTPAPEQGGYVYKIPVGQGLDVPKSWTSLTFSVTARCPGPQGLQQVTPDITVRRFAIADPLRVWLEGTGTPTWHRSRTGQDTLDFNLISNRPVAIPSLTVETTSDHPLVFNATPYFDRIERNERIIHLPSSAVNLTENTSYRIDAKFTEGGIDESPSKPLTFTSLPQPLYDYALNQTPTQDQLTVSNTIGGSSVSFSASTNDSGDLYLTFPALNVPGYSAGARIPSTSVDGRTHTFKIDTGGLPDGDYFFTFDGIRKVPQKQNPTEEDNLYDRHSSYLLKVAALTQLAGPIGLKLETGQQEITVTYCLSHDTPNDVAIYKGGSKDPQFTGSSGTKQGSCQGTQDAHGTPAYTSYAATINLAMFNALAPAQVSTTKTPATPTAPSTTRPVPASTTKKPATPTAPSTTPSKAQYIPIDLHIRDTRAGIHDVAVLNLDAVIMKDQSADVATAINQLATATAAKDSTAQNQAIATLKASNIDDKTIASLTNLFQRKDKGQAAITVLTILAGVYKI